MFTRALEFKSTVVFFLLLLLFSLSLSIEYSVKRC